MAASPAEEELYLKGISSVIGACRSSAVPPQTTPIAGEWKLYDNDESFGDGCVIALFWDAPTMTNMFTGAYHETDDFGVITKVNGLRTIAEIDGVPPPRSTRSGPVAPMTTSPVATCWPTRSPRRSASRTAWATWSPFAIR